MRKIAISTIIALLILNGQMVFSEEKFPLDKIKSIPIIELEPYKMIESLEIFKANDLQQQKQYSGIWSTINQINLSKFKITSFSSSILGKSYLSSNLYDGKASTAWVEGVKGNGINEWVKLEVNADSPLSDFTTTPFSISEIGVIPGYSKNQKTWIENNRVKKLLLIVNSPPPSSPEKNEWVVYRLKFKDENKLQLFTLPNDKVAINMEPMKKIVWIKIEEVYKGEKYDDTCISEMILIGGCSN